jgi:Carboxypeptidase regulatory-like domain
MRLAILSILLTCLSSAQNTDDAATRQAGAITGTVRSSDGAPIAGATVYALPKKNAYHGLLSLEKTDSSGNFRIENVSPGETVIYAYDLDEGYLDPHPAFNSGNKYLAVVTAIAGGVVSADVTLGPKCAYLVGAVHNSKDGTAVRNASFVLKRADDPNIWLSTSPVEETGNFRFGVPSSTPIDLQVNAVGFAAWRPDAHQIQELKAGLSSGAEYSIDIQLKLIPVQ